ncbi:uncharacterized protein LOC135339959 [Halichondria panicea]|uniref:uncharacterized protein LOC135339959 n=1 Tax=Halichondria panicea TaxID=6063 RepID=UPI00312B59EC
MTHMPYNPTASHLIIRSVMAPKMFVAIVVLAITFAEADAISYVQPQTSIRCPPRNETCYIQLTVSTMETLTAYCVKNGTRESSGFQVVVNSEGGFDFVFENLVENGNVTELFQPIVADGTTRRNLLVVNDQLPGPTIIGYKNQRVRINVTNNLGKEAITLHWHGQHVNGSSGSQNQYSDGVPYITQCPILPSNSFVYDFEFYPAGTYWYHSHQFDERSNGMYGALVVLDSDESDPGFEDIPEEHTISFFEWFPVNSDSWIEAPYALPDPVNSSVPYMSITTYDGTSASGELFFAGFMNFGGWRFNQAASNCFRVANNSLPFFNVSTNTSYRFRIIGSQVTFAYRFSISGHKMRVIATDGIDAIVPNNTAVDFIIVHVGERYDFVLNASENVDNYLMLVETLEVPSELEQRGYCVKSHRGYAVLHYDGASDVLPVDFDDSYEPNTRCTTNNSCYALNCPFENFPPDLNIQCINVGELELSNREPVPNDDVSSTAFLNFGFSRGPSINDRIFDFPQSPPLSQLEDIPPNLFCQYSVFQTPTTVSSGGPSTAAPTTTLSTQPPFTCVHTYTATNDTIEFVFMNLGQDKDISGGEAHPIHLHGHHYFIMNVGFPTYVNGTVSMINSDINCSADGGFCNTGVRWANDVVPTSACEQSNTCPLKDTVIVPVGGYVRLRFPRNNWGWWIMHCHIEPHLLFGMAMVVNETSVPGSFPVPNRFPTCENFDFSTMDPATPATEPLINPSEFTSYRDATIALAVISFLLLAAFIAVLIAFIIVCSKKNGSSITKVEIEMK